MGSEECGMMAKVKAAKNRKKGEKRMKTDGKR
jgi:hypothetical protein